MSAHSSTTISSIVSSIDERISELDQLLAERKQLVAARLALTDTPTPNLPDVEGGGISPRPAPAQPPRPRRKRQPTLTVERAIDGVRDAIADGPTSIHRIVASLGYSPTGTNPRNVVRQCLEQLGAEQTRDGWGLPSAPDPAPPPAPANGHATEAVRAEASQEDLEQAYLEGAIRRVLANGPLMPVVLANMIDAPRDQVHRACERMNAAGEIEHYADGRFGA